MTFFITPFHYTDCFSVRQIGYGGIGKRIRRLTPRECLRLQGWHDEQIDRVLAIQSDNQVYKQAGNGVTVTVVEAIGRRLADVHNELEAMDKA